MIIDIEVRGLEETQAKMEQMVQDMRGSPMLNAMRDATILVEGDAKRNLKAWQGPGTGGVDTGRLRASIMPEIRRHTEELLGVVGSNVEYAAYQELGTRPHFVSAEHIGLWAERHGLGYRGVFVTGKALRYLQKSFESNKDKIVRMFENAVGRIVGK